MSLLFVAEFQSLFPTLIILGRFGQNQAGIAVSLHLYFVLGASFGPIAGVQLLTVLGSKSNPFDFSFIIVVQYACCIYFGY